MYLENLTTTLEKMNKIKEENDFSKSSLTDLNNLSYLMCNGKVQNLVIENCVSIDSHINQTLPIMFSLGTNPTPLITLLSEELSLLSPIKKYLF